MSSELRAVADAFLTTMPRAGRVDVFRIDAMDRIGVPVVQASLILSDEPATVGYGYGLDSVEAEVGALGELCEEVHAGKWLASAPRIVASYAELLRAHGAGAVADPLTLCLPAGSDYSPDMPLSWVEGRRWATGETVLVPREWVAAYPYQLKEPARLIMPITNGLGAGLDHPHAIAHGLMEQLQRDGNVLTYRALDRGVVIDVDTEEDATVAGLMTRLAELGIAVKIKLACTDFGLTNLYIVGDDHGRPFAPIQVTACGEASHPDRSRALRKALLEFIGSRARKAATHGPLDALRAMLPPDYADRQMKVALVEEEESRALEAMAEWVGQDAPELRRRLADTVFSDRRHVPLSSLPTVPAATIANSADRLQLLADRLRAEQLELLWVDCSPPDSPVKVVKTIVPGLESETMSYHRIGWRGVKRLRDRDDPLIASKPKPGAKRVLLRPEDEARAGGPAWFDTANADAVVGKLYALYRESGPFAAQLMLARQRGAA